MTSEAAFIDALRSIATHPAARGLKDDAAVLGDLVLTHDMIVTGVHFLADDPPADVAWKLVAVNLSDLAAKGAVPVGCLLGYMLGDDAAWDAAFLDGLADALGTFAMPLLGGDTVSTRAGAPRCFSLTALGRAPAGGSPSRDGAKAGDALFVTGTIGDAGLGLRLLQAGEGEPAGPIAAYRRPQPRLADGQALAPHVHAMMDVSDGLLIDAYRMAEASGLALAIDLDRVPLSDDVRAALPVLDAVTAGDDYQLLFAAPAGFTDHDATRIGAFTRGAGLSLFDDGRSVPLPDRLGWLHG